MVKHRKDSSHLEIKGSKLCLVGGFLVVGLIAVNVAWSCNSTFNCVDFKPTVSYLACFRGHDRLFNFTMTLAGAFLSFFFVTAYANFNYFFSDLQNLAYIGLSCLISVGMPLIGIIDEANTSDLVPLERFHFWIVFCVVSCCLGWVYLTMGCLDNFNFTKSQTAAVVFLKKYLAVGLTVLFVNILQWTHEVFSEPNWLFNMNYQAYSEWCVILMGCFTPYTYSRSFAPMKIQFLS